MALVDVFSSRLAGPAGRLLDAPIRALVHEILREQGYASPIEVQSLRDDARDLAARLGRAEGRLTELVRGQEATVLELKEARDALRRAEAELQSTKAEMGAVRMAPVQEEAPAPLTAVSHGSCQVPECEAEVRSKGFCSAHYQQWRRGTLPNFVGHDGHVVIGDHSFRVSEEHVAKRAERVGDVVRIDGKAVPTR